MNTRPGIAAFAQGLKSAPSADSFDVHEKDVESSKTLNARDFIDYV